MRLISSAKHAMLALCLFYSCTNASFGQDYNLITDLEIYWPIQQMPKPNYLETVTDPVFGTKITRITGDVGNSIPNVSGEQWKQVARHGYSTRQPWNADESIIYIDRHKSGADLFLNGETYEVIKEEDIPSANETRWHPTNPDLMLLLRDDGVHSWSYSTDATNHLFKVSESALDGCFPRLGGHVQR